MGSHSGDEGATAAAPAAGRRRRRRSRLPSLVVLAAATGVLGCATTGSVPGLRPAWHVISATWQRASGTAGSIQAIGPGDALPPAAVDAGLPVTWWHPRPGVTWQLSATDSSATGSSDTGSSTGAATASRQRVTTGLAAGARVFVLDPASTDRATITAIHAAGGRAVCRIPTGLWTAASGVHYPAAVLGRSVDGYGDERYLDLRRRDTLRGPIDSLLDSCRDLGFDGVDPLGDTTVTDIGPTGTGFPLTYADQLAFDRLVAQDAHADGLAIGLDTLLPAGAALVRDAEPFTDFALVEHGAGLGGLAAYDVYARADRPVVLAPVAVTVGTSPGQEAGTDVMAH